MNGKLKIEDYMGIVNLKNLSPDANLEKAIHQTLNMQNNIMIASFNYHTDGREDKPGNFVKVKADLVLPFVQRSEYFTNTCKILNIQIMGIYNALTGENKIIQIQYFRLDKFIFSQDFSFNMLNSKAKMSNGFVRTCRKNISSVNLLADALIGIIADLRSDLDFIAEYKSIGTMFTTEIKDIEDKIEQTYNLYNYLICQRSDLINKKRAIFEKKIKMAGDFDM